MINDGQRMGTTNDRGSYIVVLVDVVSQSQPVQTGWDWVRSGPLRTGLRTEEGPSETGPEQFGPRSLPFMKI